MLRYLFALLVFFFSGIALGDDNNSGGAGGGKAPTAEELQRQVAALRDENERLKAEAAKGGKKKTKPADEGEDTEDDADEDDEDGDEDDDLREKARKQKRQAEKNAAQTRDIERALSFNMAVDDFITKNASLLPNSIPQIVKLAHKETYDNAHAKASALKAAIIQEYFAVQANLDALTSGQRATLDDYLKLTKTGKEAKAADVYENIFEPALDTVRRVKKAEEVGRGRAGFAANTESGQAYKEKLVRLARKSHLGEKEA